LGPEVREFLREIKKGRKGRKEVVAEGGRAMERFLEGNVFFFLWRNLLFLYLCPEV
jgi:hypothetical protein